MRDRRKKDWYSKKEKKEKKEIIIKILFANKFPLYLFQLQQKYRRIIFWFIEKFINFSNMIFGKNFKLYIYNYTKEISITTILKKFIWNEKYNTYINFIKYTKEFIFNTKTK